MLDFVTRKTRALRNSASLFVFVVLTQTFTAVATGVFVGYAATVPIVMVFAANEMFERPTGERDQFVATFAAAFQSPPADEVDERCVDANRVFWFNSLFCTGVTAIGLFAVTVIERRRLQQRGGWAIGLAIGGRSIHASDAKERRLANIVDEVAIAYDTTPPHVIVLDDQPGINVFAAGLKPKDSILCVTGPAIECLDRDELQAVVAHEFSHLVHGDTRLGTRLTSILLALHGIRVLADSLISLGRHRSEHPSSGYDFTGVFYIGCGLILWPLGIFGSVAATALTMSLGRTRESLADAEAVARTRHPEPLARALRRILAHPSGGTMHHTMTSIIAPMLFVEPTKRHRWFSSHPSIDQRLAAIDPRGPRTPLYDETIQPPSVHVESRFTGEVMNMVFAANQLTTTQSLSTRLASDDLRACSLVILSALATTDGQSPLTDYEFARGWSRLNFGEATRLDADTLDDALVTTAIDRMAEATPPQKQKVMGAIAHVIAADSAISDDELKLLQRIQTAWGLEPSSALNSDLV